MRTPPHHIVIEPPPRRSPAREPRAALTIAGSDSGGGAGLQADLRVFAAHGLLGTTVVTAVTAQNTLGVSAWEPVSEALVRAQLDAVLADLPVFAIKTGMLGRVGVVEAVARRLRGTELPLVVDPVMVATSGDRLLEDDAVEALVRDLLPRATIVTPNRPEAAVLSGLAPDADPMDHADAIAARAPAAWVIVKGGHRDRGDARPVVIDTVRSPNGEWYLLEAPWVETTCTHGTGCTLSAALAAALALGASPLEAIVQARRYLAGALTHAVAVGQGHGPVDHLFHLFAVTRSSA